MSPYNKVLLLLASAVALAMLLSFALPRLAPATSTVSFDSVREVALAASQLREFRLPSPARVEVSPATLEVGDVVLQASRVRLVWECPSPVYAEDLGAWSLWANGTHAGVESWVYVKDEGKVLLLYFFSSSSERVARLSYRLHQLPFKTVLRRGSVAFDDQVVYEFSGWREVRVYRAEVSG